MTAPAGSQTTALGDFLSDLASICVIVFGTSVSFFSQHPHKLSLDSIVELYARCHLVVGSYVRNHLFCSAVHVHDPVCLRNCSHKCDYQHIFLVCCSRFDAACLTLIFTCFCQKWFNFPESSFSARLNRKGVFWLICVGQIQILVYQALWTVAGCHLVHQADRILLEIGSVRFYAFKSGGNKFGFIYRKI